MPCSSPQDGMHAIVAQGGSQSKLIHFAYITPIWTNKNKTVSSCFQINSEKISLKKTNKKYILNWYSASFQKKKTNPTLAKGNSLWPLAIFHLSNFLPLSLRPKMSLTISLPCPGGTDLSPKCARLHGGSDAKNIPLQAYCLFQGQKPQIRWVSREMWGKICEQ